MAPRSSEPQRDPAPFRKLVEKAHKGKNKTKIKTRLSGTRKDRRDFLNSVNPTKAQDGERSLLKSHSEQVCSYDFQTFVS